MNPWSEKDHKVTGRWRVRRGLEKTGFMAADPVLVAQVEETYTYYPVLGPDSEAQHRIRWRDMRVTDLAWPNQPPPMTTS